MAKINGFEGGVDGTVLTTANSALDGDAASLIFTNGAVASGSCALRAASAAYGSMGMRITLAAAASYWRWDDAAATGRWVARRTFVHQAAPPTNGTILLASVQNDANTNIGFLRVFSSNGTTSVLRLGQIGADISASDSPTLTVGAKYLAEIAVTEGTTTTNGRIEYRVWNVATGVQFHTYDTGATVNTGTTGPGKCRFGGSLNTQGWTVDDVDSIRFAPLASGWWGPTVVSTVTVDLADDVAITDTGAQQILEVEDSVSDSVGVSDSVNAIYTPGAGGTTHTASAPLAISADLSVAGASSALGGITVLVDWSRDGSYAQAGDDVSSRVRPRTAPITSQYGRDQSSALAPTMSGQAAFTLDNRSRDYSPRNTASPLYGKIRPARPVKITRSIGGSEFILFVGHTDDAPINPDVDNKTVSLTLVDWLADFRGQTITTPLYRGIRTGEAVAAVLDAAGWPLNLRDLDPGGTVIPWWWEEGTDALTALDNILRSEGPPALLTVGASGEIVFRDRHHRLTRSASVALQSTWRSIGTVEPVMTRPFSYDEAWRNIVNSASVAVPVRNLGELGVVWSSEETITLSAGETRLISAATSEPFDGAIPPEVGVDYTLALGTVQASLMRTSGASAAIVLKAVGGPAILTTLQLRAQLLTTLNTVQVTATDTGSVSEYGARSFPGDLPWCGVEDAQAIVSTVVALRAQPLPIVQARFMVGQNTTRAALVLARDLSDRVRIIEAETVLNHDFYVEAISHELTGEDDHAVTFGLEAVPNPTVTLFRFDTAGQGFNQGQLGSGIDNPATIFLFDTDGRGLDAGVFAN